MIMNYFFAHIERGNAQLFCKGKKDCLILEKKTTDLKHSQNLIVVTFLDGDAPHYLFKRHTYTYPLLNSLYRCIRIMYAHKRYTKRFSRYPIKYFHRISFCSSTKKCCAKLRNNRLWLFFT